MLIFSRVPALSRLGFLIVFILSFSVVQGQDSVSVQRYQKEELKREIEELRKELSDTRDDLALIQQKDTVRLRQRIDIYLAVVIGTAILLGFFMNWVGKRAVLEYIKEYAQETINKGIEKIITKDWIAEKVHDKAQEPIEEAMAQLKKNFKEDAEKELKKMEASVQKYEQALKELTGKKSSLEASKASDPDDKKQLQSFMEGLKTVKEEEDYTARDWFWKGKGEEARGAYKESIESYTRAIRLNPQNDTAWSNRGAAKNRLSLYQEAIEDYDEAIRLNPQYEAAWNNRGAAKNSLGLYQEAIEDLDEALRLNPELPNAYAHRAYSYLMLGQLEKAEKDIVKSQSLDNTYPRGWYYLGLIRQKQNRMKEACEAWKKAMELGFKEAREKLDEFCKES